MIYPCLDNIEDLCGSTRVSWIPLSSVDTFLTVLSACFSDRLSFATCHISVVKCGLPDVQNIVVKHDGLSLSVYMFHHFSTNCSFDLSMASDTPSHSTKRALQTGFRLQTEALAFQQVHSTVGAQLLSILRIPWSFFELRFPFFTLLANTLGCLCNALAGVYEATWFEFPGTGV